MEAWKRDFLDSKIQSGEIPGGLVVMIWCFHHCGPDSIPGLGTQISHQAAAKVRKKREKKKKPNQLSDPSLTQLVTDMVWGDNDSPTPLLYSLLSPGMCPGLWQTMISEHAHQTHRVKLVLSKASTS